VPRHAADADLAVEEHAVETDEDIAADFAGRVHDDAVRNGCPLTDGHRRAGPAFATDRLAGAAEATGFAGLKRGTQGRLVHTAQHQNFAAVGIAGDAGQQAARVELGCQLQVILDLLDAQPGGEHDAAHAGTRHRSRPFRISSPGGSSLSMSAAPDWWKFIFMS